MSAEKHSLLVELGFLNPDGSRKDVPEPTLTASPNGRDAVAMPDAVALTAEQE